MKTSELTGAALDWAVAKCAEMRIRIAAGNVYPHLLRLDGTGLNYTPSTNWAQGGPIIERELISISSPRGFGWVAELWQEKTNPITGHFTFGGGDTPLIAAMRCYVASKLGDEVEIPEELL